MKTGIITFHFAHNQGAVLQCYALQKVLKNLGHDAKIINYCPTYHTVRYSAKKNPFVMAHQNWKKTKNKRITNRIYSTSRSFAKAVYLNIKQTYKKREESFSLFVNKNLDLSEKYKTLKSLKKNPPKYDVYISGSDQLWNPELLDGNFDSAYFLDFGNECVKKITYAVSLKESYTENEKITMQKLCKNLDAVCLREENDVVGEILKNEYNICIDPTLLLDMNDYEEITKETKETNPYIFVYGFQTSSGMVDAVNTISKELNLPVINGSPEKIKLNNVKNVDNYGPDEFLGYLKNAEFVITNSFHGTAFSIIFKKKFVTIAHTTRGKRMTELLEKLTLSDRLWDNTECNWKNEVNYIEADKKRCELKDVAFNYLNKNLKN